MQARSFFECIIFSRSDINYTPSKDCVATVIDDKYIYLAVLKMVAFCQQIYHF